MHLQVQNLLDIMQLPQYKERFADESISGAILSDIDEEILQEELGVTSRLHRMRLMKVVNGDHSVERILKRENPYVLLHIQ